MSGLAPTAPEERRPGDGGEGCSVVMRGFLAMVFLGLAAVAAGLWLLVDDVTRGLGRDVVLDPLAAPLLAGLVLSIVAVATFWSAFGRALVLATSVLLGAHALFGVLVAMAGAAVVGRPGGAVGVSVLPVFAALLAGLAFVVVATGPGAPRPVPRLRLLAAVTVAALGTAAAGARPIDVVVAGPARWPFLQPVVDHLAWALVGLAIALLVLSPLRAGRTVALGQALAALVVLAAPQLWSWWWLAGRGEGVEATVALGAAGAALAVAWLSAGPRHHLDEVPWQPPELVQRAAARLWGRPEPATGPAAAGTRPPPAPPADPDATLVLPGAPGPARDDRTEVVREDHTEVLPLDDHGDGRRNR